MNETKTLTEQDLTLIATLVPVDKRQARRLVRLLKTGAMGMSFKRRTGMNGRGDYGYDELYLTPVGEPLWHFSIDGARTEGRWKVSARLIDLLAKA